MQVDQIGNPVAGNLIRENTRNGTTQTATSLPTATCSTPWANGECQAMANPNFGKVTGGGSKWDPRTLEGWGVRGYKLGVFGRGAARGHSRVSVDLTYFRGRTETSPSRRPLPLGGGLRHVQCPAPTMPGCPTGAAIRWEDSATLSRRALAAVR